MEKSNVKQIVSILVIIVGFVLLGIGMSMETPGGTLTTNDSLNGEKSAGALSVYDKYSAIDEYVGGDAYNYIIGASIVSGRTAGTMVAKAIYCVGGVLCMCMGALKLSETIKGKKKQLVAESENIKEEIKDEAKEDVSKTEDNKEA